MIEILVPGKISSKPSNNKDGSVAMKCKDFPDLYIENGKVYIKDK